jgi:predicted phosphodiesterase
VKVGVFSDVHGNWEALDACLKRFKQEEVQSYIFCGDLIGYGPDPEKCVRKIMQLPLIGCVMGNHDAVFAQPEIENFFNYDARQALLRSKSLLTEKTIRCLTSLPSIVKKPGFTVLHGTPADPIKEYFSSCSQFYSTYHMWEGQICFVGHIHLPFYMKGTEKSCSTFVNKRPDVTVRLSDKARYIINPGAVGKPGDNDPRASFGIWDTDEHTFRFLRQEYDFRPTQEKMAALKFPSFLIDSLSLGL